MQSVANSLGRVQLPKPSGVRIQMMPFLVEAPARSLPVALSPWLPLLSAIARRCGERGVGYLTIDEADVARGEHHRRPGLHVDCGGPLSCHGGAPPVPPRHGGSPPSPSPHAGAGRGGMYVAASSLGSRGWVQEVSGQQGEEGDCSHLANLLRAPVRIFGGELFWCNSTFIHETLPAAESGMRQFLRVSMPSEAPWHNGYTPNPLGIRPTGPIAQQRAEMSYRP